MGSTDKAKNEMTAEGSVINNTQNHVLAKMEMEVQQFWSNNKIFEASVNMNDGKENYVFYDGPPFANGLPHYGHLLTGFVKDVFARYHTMLGQKVERKFGWDCHGLPAEMGAEKELNIHGQQEITKFGIDKFNDQCRTSVMKYTQEWEEYVTRQGRWVDFKGSYKTMDLDYMESVIWAIKQLHEKGLLYEDMRVMPYSWACETPLSNFETKLDNSYRDKVSRAVTVKFELDNIPDAISRTNPNVRKVFMLVWTTTPWTLPSNLALAVGPDIDYAVIVKKEIAYIIAADCVKKYAKEIAAL